jgi:hypothetical protein
VGELRRVVAGEDHVASLRRDSIMSVLIQPIQIENLSHTLTDVIVRFEPLEGLPKTLRVRPDNPVALIPDQQPWTAVASTYFVLGVEHILLGFDHLMFVLALLLLVRDVKRLVGAITAFAVAHSLTLAGTTFGWVKLASAPVEATIALSILFVAVEIMRVREGHSSLTATRPWLASSRRLRLARPRPCHRHLGRLLVRRTHRGPSRAVEPRPPALGGGEPLTHPTGAKSGGGKGQSTDSTLAVL